LGLFFQADKDHVALAFLNITVKIFLHKIRLKVSEFFMLIEEPLKKKQKFVHKKFMEHYSSVEKWEFFYFYDC
jgi:hypothetical protein